MVSRDETRADVGRSWVSLDDDREVAFWTAHFAVDEATLEAAMAEVGNAASEIELWLERQG